MIDWVLDVYYSLFDEIILVTNTPAQYADLHVRVLTDTVPNRHALGGLYTGLTATSSQRCFVAACDMPFLRPKLVAALFQAADVDAAVPLVCGRCQPLCAVYAKTCLPFLRTQLERRDYRLSHLLAQVHAHILTEAECASVDPEFASFININTPEEYAKWSNIIRKK